MTDRTTKFLLAVIALLLIALLVRPTAFSLTPAQAQTGSAAGRTSGQMLVDKNELYVLQNGRLSVFDVVSGALPPEAVRDANVTLRRIAFYDVAVP